MVAGEVLYSDKECIWMQFFMKDVIKEYGLENPYQLVDSGEWTMDKMIEMMDVASNDIDGNGIMLNNDMFGLVTHSENYPALWIAGGEKLVKLTEEGEFELELLLSMVELVLSLPSLLTELSIISELLSVGSDDVSFDLHPATENTIQSESNMVNNLKLNFLLIFSFSFLNIN